MVEESNGKTPPAPATAGHNGRASENGHKPDDEAEGREFERFKALTKLLVHTPKPRR